MAHQEQEIERTAARDGVEPSATVTAGETGLVASLARQAADAKACLIAFRGPQNDGCVWAATAHALRQFSGAKLTGLLEKWHDGGGHGGAAHLLAPTDGAVLRSLGIEIEDGTRLIAVRCAQAEAWVCVALLSPLAADMGRAVAELAARSASALSADHHDSERASFWRNRAAELRDSLIALRVETARSAREHEKELRAHRRLAAAAERGDLSAIASALSRLVACEGWIVAAHDRDGLRVSDTHGVERDVLARARIRVPRRALERHTVTARNIAGLASPKPQDRIFRKLGYRSYICVPVEGAAILLLSRGALTAAARARVADCCGIIAPRLRNRFLDRELERQRAFACSLVRGLFATADAERARLRRDLHDDWAQLLAAAQIAINGDGENARQFFRNLDGELRKRLEALRPQPSRLPSTSAAIDAEIQRLRRAGIRATVNVRGVSRLPAAIKEVVFRVIGEGVSNVIRHAGADRVHIEIERRDAVAVVAVTDNGRGTANGSATGLGLRGLAERVAILGGSCKLVSQPGGTQLTARIPVADL